MFRLDRESWDERVAECQVRQIHGKYDDLEYKQLRMEVDIWAALASILNVDYKAFHIDSKIFNTNIQIKTYIQEKLSNLSVLCHLSIQRYTIFSGKLFIISQNVDPMEETG